ncbi:MAG TPA: hypothetical protein VFP57_00915, partial [Sphingomicrobium sp.]|nr:hypothetical protein [Sphingomicrobium sp.]
MVQIPVQDRGTLDLRELVDLGPERPAIEPDLFGHPDQRLQRDAFERHAESPPQARQIGFQPMMSRNHRQTSKPALARFRLTDEGSLSAPLEVDETRWP